MGFYIYVCVYAHVRLNPATLKSEQKSSQFWSQISDSEDISITTHGFSSEAIPEAKDVVRIDVVGGFALQKVTPERSYFR